MNSIWILNHLILVPRIVAPLDLCHHEPGNVAPELCPHHDGPPLVHLGNVLAEAPGGEEEQHAECR